MASYRVFEFPHALPEVKASGDDVRFVRDAFSVGALVFPFLWLLWHRLWVGAAVFLVLMALLIVFVEMISPLLVLFLNSLIGLYVAFEGTNFKAGKLKNTGWHEVDLIVANDEEEAELRYFSKQDQGTEVANDQDVPLSVPSKLKTIVPSRPLSTQSRPVIGGFPTHPTGSRS